MPGGKFSLNLRNQSVIPHLLPEKEIRICVQDNGKTVIDIKVPTVSLLDSKALTQWQTWKNKNNDCRTRLLALEALRAAGWIDSKTAETMQLELLTIK